MSEVVSQVVPVMVLALGLSYLLQPSLWVQLSREGVENPHQFLPLAWLMVAIGVGIISAHTVWSPAWRAGVTLFGWLLAAKGAAFLAFGEATARASRSVTDARALIPVLRAVGSVLAAVGCWLTYAAWFAG